MIENSEATLNCNGSSVSLAIFDHVMGMLKDHDSVKLINTPGGTIYFSIDRSTAYPDAH